MNINPIILLSILMFFYSCRNSKKKEQSRIECNTNYRLNLKTLGYKGKVKKIIITSTDMKAKANHDVIESPEPSYEVLYFNRRGHITKREIVDTLTNEAYWVYEYIYEGKENRLKEILVHKGDEMFTGTTVDYPEPQKVIRKNKMDNYDDKIDMKSVSIYNCKGLIIEKHSTALTKRGSSSIVKFKYNDADEIEQETVLSKQDSTIKSFYDNNRIKQIKSFNKDKGMVDFIIDYEYLDFDDYENHTEVLEVIEHRGEQNIVGHTIKTYEYEYYFD